MAQRQFNVKVTSTIDKSLVNLLNKLDKYTSGNKVINVKAVVEDKSMTALFNKLKQLESKKVNLKFGADVSNVDKAISKVKEISKTKSKITVDAKDLDRLREVTKGLKSDIKAVKFNIKADYEDVKKASKTVDELSKKSQKTHVIKVKDEKVQETAQRIDKLSDKAEKLTSKTHTMNFDARGLSEIASTLDNLSSKILSVAGSATRSIGQGLLREAGELFDAQTSFITQGHELGLDDKAIQGSMKALNDFGKRSKYSVAELNRLAIALKGAGFDEAYGGFTNLTKGLAGFVALSPTASQDMARMAKVIADLTPDGQASKGQWNQITRAGGGAAQKLLRDYFELHYGITDINKAFREGQVTGEMMMRALQDAGNNPAFQKMALQANTLSSAWDNFKESLTVELTGTPFEKGALTPIFEDTVKVLNKLTDLTPDIAKFIGTISTDVKTTLFDKLKNLNVTDFLNGLKSGLKPLGLLVKGFAELFGLITNNGKHTGTIIGLAVSFSALWLAGRKLYGVFKSLSSLGGIGSILGGKGGKGASGAKGVAGALDFQGLVNTFKNVTLLVGIASSIKIIASAMKDLDSLEMNWLQLGEKLSMMAVTLGVTMLAMNKIGKTITNNPNLKTQMIKGATTLAGVGIALLGIAKIMEKLNGINFDFGNVARELGSMAIILGLATTAMVGVGQALSMVKNVKSKLVLGAVALEGVALSLIVISKTMEQLNGINFDFENVANELTEMAKVLGVSTVALGLIGLAVAKIPLVAPALALGALALTAIATTLLVLATEMLLVAKATEEFAKTVRDINNIDLPDPDTFVKKMADLGKMVGAISALSAIGGTISFVGGIGAIFGTIGNIAQGIYLDSVRNLIDKVNGLIDLASKAPDKGTIESAMKKLGSLMEALRGDNGILALGESKGADFLEFWDSISDTLVNIAQKLEVETLIDSMTKVAKFIEKMQSVDIPNDLGGVKEKITSLKNLMDELTTVTRDISNIGGKMGGNAQYSSTGSIGGVITSMLQSMELDNLITGMTKLSDFVAKLRNVPAIDDSAVSDLQKKLGSMKRIMDSLKVVFNDPTVMDFGFLSDIANMWSSQAQTADLTAMINGFTKVIDFVNAIKKLRIDDSTVTSIQKKLEQIKKVIEEINKFEIPNIKALGDGNVKGLESINKMLDTITQLIEKVLSIPETDISAKITSIEKALSELKRLPEHEAFTTDIFGGDVVTRANNISKFVTALSQVADSLTQVMNMGDLSGIETKVEQIKKALEELSKPEFLSALSKFEGKDYSTVATTINNLITSLNSIANGLTSLPLIESETVTTKITAIKNALKGIAEEGEGGSILTLLAKFEGLGESFTEAQSVIQSIVNIATSLQSIPDIASLDIPTRLSKIHVALEAISGREGILGDVAKLEGKAESFNTATQVINAIVTVANALNSLPVVNAETVMATITAIKNAIKEIESIAVGDGTLAGLTAVINKLKEIHTAAVALSASMTTEGTTAGNNYVTGFITALGTRPQDKVKEAMNAIIALDWLGTGTNIANKLVQGFETGLGTKLQDKVDRARRAIEALDWSGTGSRVSSALANGFNISGILAKINQIQSAINGLRGRSIDVTINETTVRRTVNRRNGGIIPEYHSTGGVIGRGWRQSGTDTVPAMLTAGEYVLKRSVSSYLGQQFLDALNSMNLTQALKHLANKTGNQVVHNTTNNITQNVDNKASYLNGLTELKGVIRA